MKPICFPCERFMRPKKNGIYFIEGMPDHTHQPGDIGRNAPGWRPYKLWVGDLWHCPTCGAQTIVGTGRAPISVQHEPNFIKLSEVAKGYMVKDC